MGADEQRFSLIAQFFQNRRILHPGARIQPGSRFIQDQESRIVDERPRQTEALLHTSRKPVHEKVLFIFQPHLFSRTMFFASEFAEALAKADDVIVTGIFPAREKQEDYPTISSATIVDEALKLDHTPAEDWIRGVEDMHTAAQMMTMRAHHGDDIFTVGAGDITQMDEVMLHSLQAHRWDCEG